MAQTTVGHKLGGNGAVAKANGKAATYYVTLTPPAGFGAPQTQSITLKANGYLEVDFTTK